MQKTIDGIRLAYDDAGTGDVLVLLHGFTLDRTLWDAQVGALSRSARVIPMDLRGSGESGCGAGPALMETMAGDVFGLLDALDVERAIIAGHSLGGYVALAFFRMYAERVAGLALVGSHVGADAPTQRTARDLLAARVATEGMRPAVDAYLPRFFNARTLAADPALVARTRAMMERQNPLGAAAQIVGMKERVGSEDLLEDIGVPTLIVGGDMDDWIAPETLERTAAAIADCEYVRLPEVGHLPMLEAPDETTAALARLIERCAVKGVAR